MSVSRFSPSQGQVNMLWMNMNMEGHSEVVVVTKNIFLASLILWSRIVLVPLAHL